MTRWTVEFTAEAEDDFARLATPLQKRILEKLEWFSENFDAVISIPLTGEFREFYKLRVGDWRIFYKISHSDRFIAVHYIDHRDKAYRKKRS